MFSSYSKIKNGCGQKVINMDTIKDNYQTFIEMRGS
jgi:hypothetical protein